MGLLGTNNGECYCSIDYDPGADSNGLCDVACPADDTGCSMVRLLSSAGRLCPHDSSQDCGDTHVCANLATPHCFGNRPVVSC
eukprot:SAG11_NODE_7_length_31267_cov_19.541966_18_plen_83_part_00